MLCNLYPARKGGHVMQYVANLTLQVGSHTTLAAVDLEGQCM